MNLSKVTTPWWVPGWLWNKAIGMAVDYAKSELSVGKIAEMAGDKCGDLMEKAVHGKDPGKVKAVCANCTRAATLFGRISSALEDGSVTAAERTEISGALAEVVTGFITQSEIDAKIDEIAVGLKA